MDRRYRLAWNLRAAALAVWAARPLFGALSLTLDARIEYGLLFALTVAATVAAATARMPAREKVADLLVSALFVAYFAGWLAWLLAPYDAEGLPPGTDPRLMRAATAGGLLVLASLTRAERRHPAAWVPVGLAALVWVVDLPTFHQPLFLAAPRIAELLPLVGTLAALTGVQVVVPSPAEVRARSS